MDKIVPTAVRSLFKGRIFSVQVETIVLPKGGTLEAEIVRHPGSVVIVPVTDSGAIILVRQYRPAIGRWAWELPAGSLEPGEDVAKAALRECQEEVGKVAVQLERLGAFYPTPGYCDELMTFYRATGLRDPGPDDADAHQDEDEDIETGEFTVEEIRRMIGAGEIIDLKTVAGIALLRDSSVAGLKS